MRAPQHRPANGAQVRPFDEPVSTPDRPAHRLGPIGRDVELGRRVGIAYRPLDERPHPPSLRPLEDIAREVGTPIRGEQHVGDAREATVDPARRDHVKRRVDQPVDVVERPQLGTGDLERHGVVEKLVRRHPQAERATRDPLVEVELHPVPHQRHGVRELVVPLGQGIALHPSCLPEQLVAAIAICRVDQEVDVADLAPGRIRVVEVRRGAALEHRGPNPVFGEQPRHDDQVVLELHAARQRRALERCAISFRCSSVRSVGTVSTSW